MEFSDVILNYFDKNCIKPATISKATGIDKSTFSKWKSKPTSKIDLETVNKIAKYLNISIDSLLSNVEDNQQVNNSIDNSVTIEFSDKKISPKINLKPQDNLRYLQDELTDSEMAQIGGISLETYKKYLLGTTPSIQALINYSKHFGVSINHILGISYSKEELSIEELELLNTFRSIDNYGRRATKMVAFIEKSRVEDNSNKYTDNSANAMEIVDLSKTSDTMFYDILKKLCDLKSTNIIAVLKNLGLNDAKSAAWCTSWRNGSIPSGDVLLKLANYFNVSVDYLLGNCPKSTEEATTLWGISNIDEEIYSQVKQYAKFLMQEKNNNDISASIPTAARNGSSPNIENINKNDIAETESKTDSQDY